MIWLTFTGAGLGSALRAKSRICSTMRFNNSILSPMIRTSSERGSLAGNFKSSE